MSQPKPPSEKDALQALIHQYPKYIAAYLQSQPDLLNAEVSARNQYDPQLIAEQQGIQARFGPTQYAQQLQALRALDPTGYAAREQLGHQVTSDAALGGRWSPSVNQQVLSNLGAIAARTGNTTGNAATAEQVAQTGLASQNLYQQRLQNLGAFLSSPSPEQQLLAVQPVSAGATPRYINPNAGPQFAGLANNQYQNLLAQYQLSQGGGQNLWGIAGGLAGGAVGGAYGGYGGAQIGSTGGYALGNYFGNLSDKRLKTKIQNLYRDRHGIMKRVFEYKGEPGKYVGYLAQDVEKLFPEHVGETDDGLLTVSEAFAPQPV